MEVGGELSGGVVAVGSQLYGEVRGKLGGGLSGVVVAIEGQFYVGARGAALVFLGFLVPVRVDHRAPLAVERLR